MLKDLFISEVRINILKLLLLNPEESLHVRAIVRAVKAEINAVRRELENLHNMNLSLIFIICRAVISISTACPSAPPIT